VQKYHLHRNQHEQQGHGTVSPRPPTLFMQTSAPAPAPELELAPKLNHRLRWIACPGGVLLGNRPTAFAMKPLTSLGID
jgi:hypothetical protein